MKDIRPYYPHLVAAVSVSCLVLVSWLLWREVGRRFPNIEPGSYSGIIKEVFKGDKDKPTFFYLEHLPHSDTLHFVVMRDGWVPQAVNTVIHGSEDDPADWLLPVTLIGPNAKLKLVGKAKGERTYEGFVDDMDHGIRGSWSLAPLESESKNTSTREASETKLWLQLKAELNSVERNVTTIEELVPKQRAEIEKLTSFITEGELLRKHADTKFSEAKADRQKAEELVNAKREDARKLQAQFDLSQNLTGLGKLVSLSRKSIENENRWIERALQQPIVASGGP